MSGMLDMALCNFCQVFCCVLQMGMLEMLVGHAKPLAFGSFRAGLFHKQIACWRGSY